MSNKNCPNCGAPITADKCPYCGTVLIDMTCVDTKKPFYLRIKGEHGIVQAKVKLIDIETVAETAQIESYDYVRARCVYRESPPKITLEMLVIE